MITHIDGILEEKNPAYIIIDVNGIGYFLYITLQTYGDVPEKGRIRLFTQFIVREDSQKLYGFSSEEERKMFNALINVSGVGANTAMLVLSSLKSDELVSAILSDDVALLKKIKGIGAKSAQRIIIDLKDKSSCKIRFIKVPSRIINPTFIVTCGLDTYKCIGGAFCKYSTT